MEDTYVYVSVKLYLKNGQTEDSIQEIVQECDYRFNHDEIIDTEIVDIMDMQIPSVEQESVQQLLPLGTTIKLNPFDPFED
tara:strand:+ start:1081 stop:1323 length:243 start_codon:yes stop_codon:yes gene_type:complete